MKNKNLKNRIIVFISCIALLFSLLSVNAFAADPVPPFNNFLDGQGFQDVVFLPEEVNINTINAIYDYYDLLFRYNMTNGMRLVCVSFRWNGSYGYEADLVFVSGSNWGANNDADTNALTFYQAVRPNYDNPSIYLDVVNSEGTNINVRVLKGTMTTVGNLSNISYNSVSQVVVNVANVAYLDRHGDVNVWRGTYTIISDTGDAAHVMVHNIDMLTSFVGSFGSQVVNSYDLDIGSIFTAMMTAGMSIFNGFFGFTLFGINIAGTLVAILVVAIVIFIVKWLLGGK